MSEKSSSRSSSSRSSSSRRSSSRSSSSRRSSSRNSSKTESIHTLLRENIPRLSTPLSEEEIMSLQIKPREVANTALRNNSQGFMEMFFSNDKVQEAFGKIDEYNSRDSLTHSFEFFIVRLKEEYLYFYIDNGEPKVISINTRAAESKFVVLLDKLDSVFKTSGFKVCSSVLSKEYINYCLQNNEFFVIAFGMHKRHTKLKNKLSKETPNKKLSHIIAYDCLGFSFLERYKKSKESIYLNAICSNKGFGDKILNITELISEFMLFNKMYLSAVDTALSYYISRDYEIIINRKSGKNLKYIVDPTSRRSIKKPIPGSKELYGYQGSLMFKSTKKGARNTSKSNAKTNSTVRRSARSRKRENNSGPKQYILQNVSFDSDSNINMVKELNQFK